MSLFYKQNAAARYFVDQTNGKVYEVVGGSAALLCWRNGVKKREKVAELSPGLDELWGGEALTWGLAREECCPAGGESQVAFGRRARPAGVGYGLA